MEPLNIKDMYLSDFKKIENIYDTEFPNTWKISILESELNNSSSKYIVAYMSEKIVGFAGVLFSVDTADITNIVVRKSYRHMGIGSKLLEELINLTKANNKACLTLEVNINNVYAQQLYNKYNFKNLGIRKKYYNGTDDAYIMTLYL